MRKVLLLSLISLAMILSINYAIGNLYAGRDKMDSYSSIESSPDQISEMYVSIYPNPLTEDRLTIEANKVITEIIILDIVGKTIYREKFESGFTYTTVNFKDFSKGLYILKIAFEGKKFHTEKILYK